MEAYDRRGTERTWAVIDAARPAAWPAGRSVSGVTAVDVEDVTGDV